MDLRMGLRRLTAACVFGVGAMVVAAAPAAAQDACPALEAAPTLPDGATATPAQMQAGNDAYQAWGTARHAALQCYRSAVEPLVAAVNVRRAAHDAAANYLNAVSAAWQAQVATFNARQGGAAGAATTIEMPTPPAADDSACPAFAPAAQIPSGASATRAQIDAYNQQYTIWGGAFRSALQCRAAEVGASEARMAPLVQTYNTGNTELGEVNTSWEAEVAEFTARNPQARPERDRRSRTNDRLGNY